MKMRSFQVCQCGAPLQMNEAEAPKPAGTQVLLKMLAAGVCHSDLHIWDGYYEIGGGKKLMLADRGIKLPLTMGHENVGEVVALGPDAKDVKVGDVRLVNPWMGCGECKVCRRGDENLCLKPQNVGVFNQGGYATHMLVPSHRHLFDIGNLKPSKRRRSPAPASRRIRALKKVESTLKDEPVVDHRRRRRRPDGRDAREEDGREGRHHRRHRRRQARRRAEGRRDEGGRRQRGRCRAADPGRDRRRRVGDGRFRRLRARRSISR